MKKTLLILALILTLPSMAFAKCEGGTEITGKNGHVYCQSDKKMNWWSAFAWCKVNSRTLATLDQACNNQKGETACENMVFTNRTGDSATAWTSIASGDNKAYYVQLYFSWDKTLYADPRTNSKTALCY